MRISYERSGGFMGRKIHFSVDLGELTADQAKALQALVDQADFFHLPENLISGSQPDGFSYTITAEVATGVHTVRVDDGSVPDSMRPLLEDLSARARTAGRKPRS